MRSALRLLALTSLAAAAAGVACSVDTEGTGEPAPTGGDDAGSDVTTGGPDGAVTDDGGGGDTAQPPVDAGPDTATTNCKAANCALSIAAGLNHTCVVLGDRTVKCWGDNSQGQLGFGVTDGGSASPSLVAVPTAAAGISNAVSVGAGGSAGTTSFSCALLAGGVVQCWGSNNAGQLGAASANVSVSAVTVALDASAKAVDLGAAHACAIDESDGVRCWGSNAYGERGIPAFVRLALPLDAGVTSVAAGLGVTCAVGGGSLVCVGANQSRQAAPQSDAAVAPPSVVEAGAASTRASAGREFTCADISGGVACWGSNSSNRLGRALPALAYPPASPTFVEGVAAVSVTAGDYHACAIMEDRGVNCWGANNRGQSGDFTGKATVTTPAGVGGVSKVVQLAIGGEHSCALNEDGDVYCWGANNRGQLALPTPDGSVDNASHPDPVKVPL